jgi:hypothetical protein
MYSKAHPLASFWNFKKKRRRREEEEGEEDNSAEATLA